MTRKKQIISILIIILPFFTWAQNNIELFILNKNYDEALKEIDKQLLASPNPNLFLKKGLVYQNLQDYQNALQAFITGLQYDTDNAELMAEAAESFSILGNSVDALKFYEKASALWPENFALTAKLGRTHINLKNYPKAYEVFAEIYKHDSSNVYWNKQLAYSAFRIYKRAEAVYLYEKVIEEYPRDYGSYSNLIHAYNWKKEGGKIMTTIEKGLQQFPDNADLIFEKAMYLYKTKQYQAAMNNFEKYMELETEVSYETIMNYGISTYFAEHVKQALEIFNDLQQQNPNDPLVMYYQSLCFKKLKDFEKAEEYMQWAIDASIPNYVAEMHHHLGQILGQQRKFKASIAALEKSYELNPEKHEVLFEIATTYEEFNNNKTLALNYYRIYLKEAGEQAKNTIYALNRIDRLKEDLFFEE